MIVVAITTCITSVTIYLIASRRAQRRSNPYEGCQVGRVSGRD
jgi:hypothetical protein